MKKALMRAKRLSLGGCFFLSFGLDCSDLAFLVPFSDFLKGLRVEISSFLAVFRRGLRLEALFFWIAGSCFFIGTGSGSLSFFTSGILLGSLYLVEPDETGILLLFIKRLSES